MDYPTEVISIDFNRIRKGDVISNRQVEHHFIENIVGRDTYDQQLAEYQRGERLYHPISRAHAVVSEQIMRECRERGYRVVCRGRQKSIEVLTDSQAIGYRSNRANSALGLHKRQLDSLRKDIDITKLTKDECAQHRASVEFHTMIELSISSGKKTLKALQAGRLKVDK